NQGWGAHDARGMTYAILKERDTGKELVFINTHFDHVSDRARKEEARFVSRFIKRSRISKLPIVLTGDLNCSYHLPTEKAHWSLEPYYILYWAGLTDVMRAIEPSFPPRNTFHRFEGADYTPDEHATWLIDYIFVKGFQPKSFEI